jgi:hypothetical protein
MGGWNMRLKYPAGEREKVIDLCMEKNEKVYFVQVGIDEKNDMLIYKDLAKVEDGEKFSVCPLDALNEIFEMKKRAGDNGTGYIMGHTHPLPEGKRISPAYAGWTIGRTPELRDYRNVRLLQRNGGKDYLNWRNRKIREYHRKASDPEAQKRIAEEIFNKSIEFGDASLIEENGLLFYITGRIGSEKDICEGGDTSNFVGMKNLFVMSGDDFPCLDYALHAKPREETIWTPSSKDKFEVVAMKYNPDAFGMFEKVEIIE